MPSRRFNVGDLVLAPLYHPQGAAGAHRELGTFYKARIKHVIYIGDKLVGLEIIWDDPQAKRVGGEALSGCGWNFDGDWGKEYIRFLDRNVSDQVADYIISDTPLDSNIGETWEKCRN